MLENFKLQIKSPFFFDFDVWYEIFGWHGLFGSRSCFGMFYSVSGERNEKKYKKI